MIIKLHKNIFFITFFLYYLIVINKHMRRINDKYSLLMTHLALINKLVIKNLKYLWLPQIFSNTNIISLNNTIKKSVLNYFLKQHSHTSRL